MKLDGQRCVVVAVEMITRGSRGRCERQGAALTIDKEIERDSAFSVKRGARSVADAIEPERFTLLAQILDEFAPVFWRQNFAEKFCELPEFLAVAQFGMAGDVE